MITKDIDRLVENLKQGKIASLPTETVYGLAARFDNESAIKKIFETKQRPYFDPLILHVENFEQAKLFVKKWPRAAEQLAKTFWPGPLTLVLEKNEKILDLITAGKRTVGIRAPAHPTAQDVLKKLGVPFVAPSANRFKRTSPTTAEHVQSEFPQADFLILDGGPCEIGIESTVVELRENELVILRKGMIGGSQLSDACGLPVREETSEKSLGLSPGTLAEHYQPEIPLHIISESQRPELLAKGGFEIQLEEDPLICARFIYAKLKALSPRTAAFAFVVRKAHHHGEAWEAIWDRLTRAAAKV